MSFEGKITQVLLQVVSSLLASYLEQYGQEGLARAARERRSVLGMMKKHRPDLMRYLRMARKVRHVITWDNRVLLDLLTEFLEERGYIIDEEIRGYLLEQIEEVRRAIYG